MLADDSHSPCCICAILNFMHSTVKRYKAEHRSPITPHSLATCNPSPSASGIICQFNNLQHDISQTHSHFKWLAVILVLGKDRDRMWFFMLQKKGIGDRQQQKLEHKLIFFSAVATWGTSHLRGRPYLCQPLFTHFYPTQ